MQTVIRDAVPSDAESCGGIMHEAFGGLAKRHGFPSDFPSIDAAVGLARALIDNDRVFGVVAEVDGRVIGSNFLSESDPVRGVGPITVDPKAQGIGIGRCLMRAVLDRANGAFGVRLLQDSFNTGSLALYASLGFEVREPVLVMSGRPEGVPPAGTAVRPMNDGDIEACDALYVRAHGVSRRGEVVDALRSLGPLVADRQGRVTAYMTAPGFWLANHGVADSNDDMEALILGAAAVAPVSFLLPIRQAILFRWCLDRGMKGVKPMTLMSRGDYRQPDRPYMPSVFY